MPTGMDDRELRGYVKLLGRLRKKDVPHATRNHLNRMAFTAQKFAKGNIRGQMTLRNRFVERSVQVRKARGMNVRTQISFVGSPLELLATQEFSGSKDRPTLPTTVASGEGKGVRPRRKLPRRSWASRNIEIHAQRGKRARSQKQRNAIAIAVARKRKDKFAYLKTAKMEGLFRITKTQVRAVAVFWQTPVDIPANPWLGPAGEAMRPRAPGIWKAEFVRQLRRSGVRLR